MKIDFPRIFKNAKKTGLKYPFTEHDMPADAFDSLGRSMAFLKKKYFEIKSRTDGQQPFHDMKYSTARS